MTRQVRRNAFLLVEMLVVIAILAIVVAGAIQVSNFGSSNPLTNARSVKSTLEQLRELAILNNCQVSVVMDGQTLKVKTATLGGVDLETSELAAVMHLAPQDMANYEGEWTDLATPMQQTSVTAQLESGAEIKTLVFNPDGTVDDGLARNIVVSESGAVTRIHLNAATGLLEIR